MTIWNIKELTDDLLKNLDNIKTAESPAEAGVSDGGSLDVRKNPAEVITDSPKKKVKDKGSVEKEEANEESAANTAMKNASNTTMKNAFASMLKKHAKELRNFKNPTDITYTDVFNYINRVNHE